MKTHHILRLILTFIYLIESISPGALSLEALPNSSTLRPMAVRNSDYISKSETSDGLCPAFETELFQQILVRNQIIVEVEYDGSSLKAWVVKDLGKEYQPGITREKEYRGDEVLIGKLFTKKQKEALTEWIENNTLKAPLKGKEIRRTKYVRFRIALNQAALEWNKDFANSNIASASYYDRAINIGEYLLKYLLRDGQEGLRGEVLTSALLPYLRDGEKTRPPRAVKQRLTRVISDIESRQEAIKGKLYEKLLLEVTLDREDKALLEDMGISETLEHIWEDFEYGYDLVLNLPSAEKRCLFSVCLELLPQIRNVLLTEKEDKPGPKTTFEIISILAEFVKRFEEDKVEVPEYSRLALAAANAKYNLYNYIKKLIKDNLDALEDKHREFIIADNILKVLTEKNCLLNLPALYTLFNIALKDPLIAKSLDEISYGAAINLKLKAYYMLWKEKRSAEEVIGYLKMRVKECIRREKDLKEQSSVGCEVEIWRCIKDYPVKSAEFLAKAFGIVVGGGGAIEFSPDPARGWRDIAEMIDTMKALGMVPTQKDEALSLHITVAVPFKDEKYDREIYTEGLNLITLAEAFLTSVDERLTQEFSFIQTYEDDADKNGVVPGEGDIEGLSAQFKVGNVVSDKTLEFYRDGSKSGHRRALRMVKLLYTALACYLKEEKENMQERQLSDLYGRFRRDFKEFLAENKLDFFIDEGSGDGYIEKVTSPFYIYEVRTPELRKAMQGVVEKYLRRIEEVQENTVLRKIPSYSEEEKEIDGLLSDCRTNIRLAYLVLAEELKEAGYDIPDSDTDPGTVMEKEIEEIDLRDFTTTPYGSRLFTGTFLDTVPGIEIAGMVARERGVNLNLLYFLPDKNLYTNGQALFARYALFIDSNQRLRMGRFQNPQLITAFITGGRVKTEEAKKFLHKRNIELLDSEYVKEFTVDKMGFYRFLKKYSLAYPSSILIEKDLTIKDVKKRLKNFIGREDINDFVIKPRSGMGGLFVEMFNRDEIDAALSCAQRILDNGFDIIAQKRIVSKEYYIDGKRIDWNIRAFTTWKNGRAVADPDMFGVRYKEFGKGPVNYDKGAKILSLSEFFEKIGLNPQGRKKFIKGITGLIKPATRKFFVELKRRNPDIDPMKLKPGLIGWDLMQNEKERWYIIEANSGQVGGMQSLEKIYNRSDKKRRGNALAPLLRYLEELADKGWLHRWEKDLLKNRKVEAELDVSEEPDLLFDLGYAYRFIDDRKAATIFNRVANLLLGSGTGLNETEAETWYNLGLTLSDLEEYGGSEKALRFAVKLAPDQKEFWFDLGEVLYLQKKYKEVTWALRKALKIDPEYKEAEKLLRRASSILKRRTRSSSAGSRTNPLQNHQLYVAIAAAA